MDGWMDEWKKHVLLIILLLSSQNIRGSYFGSLLQFFWNVLWLEKQMEMMLLRNF